MLAALLQGGGKTHLKMILGSLFFLVCFLSLQVRDLHAENIIEKRQMSMKLMSSKMATIMQMLQGRIRYQSDAVIHGVREMLGTSGAKLTQMYGLEMQGKGSQANEQVLKNPKEFSKMAIRLEKTLQDFLKLAEESAHKGTIEKAQAAMGRGSYENYDEKVMKAAMKEIAALRAGFTSIANTCRACHQIFMKPVQLGNKIMDSPKAKP